MRKLLLLLTLLQTFFSSGQNATVSLLKRFGGTQPSGTVSLATDAAGNIYSTGYFSGTGDFDPGTGIAMLTATGLTDVYIKKDDAAGNLLWVQQISGDHITRSTSISVDATGNIYLSGYFLGTTDLDPGPALATVTNSSINALFNAFVCKLDNSGNFIWGHALGDSFSQCIINSIAADADGNLHATGMFSQTVDFDPGPGSTVFNTPSLDGFVLKFTTGGSLAWAGHFVTTYNNFSSIGTFSNSIALDAAGNVYTTGNFNDTVDFDPGPGVYKLYTDDLNGESPGIFISKLDAGGNFVFAKHFEGGGESKSIAVDAAGNIITTGFFESPVDFDPGPGQYLLTNNFGRNSFVSKLDAAGNFAWARHLNGNTNNGNAVTTDAAGNIYVTGDFLGETDFDPGIGIYRLNPSEWDIFTLKLTAEGNFAWAKQISGCGNDFGYAIISGAAGCIYTAGLLESAPAYADQITDNQTGDMGFIQQICPCSNCPASLCLGSRVWQDLNNNGIDNNEPGFEGITVYLYRDFNNDNQPDEECKAGVTLTDANGNYSFCGLQPGNYLVGLQLPYGYLSSLTNGGDPDNNTDLDNNGVVLISSQGEKELRGLSITLLAGAEPGGNTNNTYDFGLIAGPLTLGNRVWNDLNNNGRDDREPGMAEVPVNLYKVGHNNTPVSQGVFIGGTSTDAEGYYTFTNLFPGKYIVVVETPAGFASSTPNHGDPDNNHDKDDNGLFTDETGTRGLAITLTVGQEPGGNINNTYDFGFHEACSAKGKSSNAEILADSPVQLKTAFPNPFTESITLMAEAKATVLVKISLWGSDGRLVQHYSRPLFSGSNAITISGLKHLPAGVYTVMLQYGDKTVRSRVAKQ